MTTKPEDQAPNPAPADTAPTNSPTNDFAAIVAELKGVKAQLDELKALTSKPAPAPAAVPTTDTSKPTVTPVTPDLTTLPPIARMAAGYSSKE